MGSSREGGGQGGGLVMTEKDKRGLKALSMNKGSVAIQSAYLMNLLPPPHPLYTKLMV